MRFFIFTATAGKDCDTYTRRILPKIKVTDAGSVGRNIVSYVLSALVISEGVQRFKVRHLPHGFQPLRTNPALLDWFLHDLLVWRLAHSFFANPNEDDAPVKDDVPSGSDLISVDLCRRTPPQTSRPPSLPHPHSPFCCKYVPRIPKLPPPRWFLTVLFVCLLGFLSVFWSCCRIFLLSKAVV